MSDDSIDQRKEQEDIMDAFLIQLGEVSHGIRSPNDTMNVLRNVC